MTLQIVRDWVLRFNAEGPEGLIGRKAPSPDYSRGHGVIVAQVPWRGVTRPVRGGWQAWRWQAFGVEGTWRMRGNCPAAHMVRRGMRVSARVKIA